MEKILEIKNLTKNFGSLKAVSKVNLDVLKGEILGLIGPNGAGKSTFLNLLTGSITPDSGKILFKKRNITGEKPYKICRMGIAKTSQLVQPFTRLTVFENVFLAATYGAGLSSEKAENFANEILKFTSLYKIKDKLSDKLSVPERKKLELSRALATEPEILLLDENMSGLTVKEIEEALDLIKEINSRGISIVVVEHVMKVIKSISKRIVVLNYGEKIADGLPDEVFNSKEVEKAYFG
jgi:branched-chain amino acid transport system ATP-binding protein